MPKAPGKATNSIPADSHGLLARRAAAELVEGVLGRGLFFDDVEAEISKRLDALSPRDRGFARALAMSVFRRLGDIDAALARWMSKPPPNEARMAHAVLRIGAADLLFLRTPAYAAVDAAVRLCAGRNHRFRGLVNAVLRKIADNPPANLDRADAGRGNTPTWLWKRLVADWGKQTANVIATAHLATPPLDLTLKTAIATDPTSNVIDALIRQYGAERLSTGSLRLRASGALRELPGYDAGDWWVQDAAAAAPVRLLGAEPGVEALDLCAAPGGKTLQLADTGATVTALDSSDRRLERVRENLARTKLKAEIILADARSWSLETDRRFDAILLDAPCSASGTLRRHPEGAHVKSLGGLKTLDALQRDLLDAAWRVLKPGGRLVYCVCSVFKSEGEDRALAFVRATPDAALDPVALDILADSSLIDPAQGWMRALPSHWPQSGGLDGFFACRIMKRQ